MPGACGACATIEGRGMPLALQALGSQPGCVLMNRGILRTTCRLSVYLLIGAGLAACQTQARRESPTAVDTRAIEDTLRAIVTQSFKDIEAKNAEGVLRPMTEDIVFVGDGMMIVGRDSLMRMTTRAFSEWRTVKAELKITRVQVLAPDAAVLNWESHVNATTNKGVQIPLGGMVTAVFVKRDGKWLITQQQQCAPMPPEVPTNMKPEKAIPES
jgi:uncharacterized protein (TIGR02246 family)